MYDNDFEIIPGRIEKKPKQVVPPEQDFASNFSRTDLPPFDGKGQVDNTHNTMDDSPDASDKPSSPNYDNSIANAATLINYGLDAVAREKGVEAVVQGIKSFDVSKSDNPLRGLYHHLGVNDTEDLKNVQDKSVATKEIREKFHEEYNMVRPQNQSREGIVKAIADMKELITEVEGADPKYRELRSKAKASGEGYFEHAVKGYGLRGLAELFSVLANQKEQKEQKKRTRQRGAKALKQQEKPDLAQIAEESQAERRPSSVQNQELGHDILNAYENDGGLRTVDREPEVLREEYGPDEPDESYEPDEPSAEHVEDNSTYEPSETYEEHTEQQEAYRENSDSHTESEGHKTAENERESYRDKEYHETGDERERPEEDSDDSKEATPGPSSVSGKEKHKTTAKPINLKFAKESSNRMTLGEQIRKIRESLSSDDVKRIAIDQQDRKATTDPNQKKGTKQNQGNAKVKTINSEKGLSGNSSDPEKKVFD